MKILITGNLGYLGPGVVRQLRSRFRGSELVGVDLGYFSHCLTNASRVPEAMLDCQYFADIRGLRPELLVGTDAVVHLAAISSESMGRAYEDVTLEINHRAGIRLARYAKAAGVRTFVFASSCSVYGSADGRPQAEHAEVRPASAYARAQVLTEEGLRVLSGSNFRVSCLRFAEACGMSERLRLDLTLHDFVAAAMATGRIAVPGDGASWRSLIDVEDLARAVEWAVGRDDDDRDDFLVVNIGSDEWNYQLNELADAVAAVVAGTEVSIGPNAPADERSSPGDFSLFRMLAPGHQPRADLTGTISAVRDGLSGMRFNDPDFRNSRFCRLFVLADLEHRNLLSRTLEWTDKPSRAVARASAPVGAVADSRPAAPLSAGP